jgi:hypothetical protein
MATARSVLSRLFLWGAIAPSRDATLVKQVVAHVRQAAQVGRPILWAVDGIRAWTTSALRVFRDSLRTGRRSRPPLRVWADLHVVQVVKQYTWRRLVGVERRLAHGSYAVCTVSCPRNR